MIYKCKNCDCEIEYKVPRDIIKKRVVKYRHFVCHPAIPYKNRDNTDKMLMDFLKENGIELYITKKVIKKKFNFKRLKFEKSVKTEKLMRLFEFIVEANTSSLVCKVCDYEHLLSEDYGKIRSVKVE